MRCIHAATHSQLGFCGQAQGVHGCGYWRGLDTPSAFLYQAFDFPRHVPCCHGYSEENVTYTTLWAWCEEPNSALGSFACATSGAVRCAVLCGVRCAVLCCAVLCCAVLCCAVLCCAVLCCAVRCCAVLCGAVLCCAVRCAVRCAALCCAVLCGP